MLIAEIRLTTVSSCSVAVMRTVFLPSKVRDQLRGLEVDGGTSVACDRPCCGRRLNTTLNHHDHHRYHQTYSRHHLRKVSGRSVCLTIWTRQCLTTSSRAHPCRRCACIEAGGLIFTEVKRDMVRTVYVQAVQLVRSEVQSGPHK